MGSVSLVFTLAGPISLAAALCAGPFLSFKLYRRGISAARSDVYT